MIIDNFLKPSNGYADYFKRYFWYHPMCYDLEVDQNILLSLAKTRKLSTENILIEVKRRLAKIKTDDKDQNDIETRVLISLKRLVELAVLTETNAEFEITIPLYRQWIGYSFVEEI